MKSLEKTMLYNDALVRLLSFYENKELTKEYYKKIVFLGVKCIASFPVRNCSNYDEVKNMYVSVLFIKEMITKLTIEDFINVFPIQKTYDGERFQCKDYFYTNDYLKKFNMNDNLKDEDLDELLWEYHNVDIRLFNTAFFMIVDSLRRFDGKQSMMEEWADANGVSTYKLHKDSNGKEYLYDKKTRKTIRVRKPKPRYLKVIK